MARMNMRPQPWLKHMESYTDFSGGLNTEADVTKMSDNEVSDISNMDISSRGSLKRRYGMKNHKRGALWGDVKGMVWGELNN